MNREQNNVVPPPLPANSTIAGSFPNASEPQFFAANQASTVETEIGADPLDATHVEPASRASDSVAPVSPIVPPRVDQNSATSDDRDEEPFKELTFAERHSSWMVSFCVHALSLIILALMIMPQAKSGSLTLDMTMNGDDSDALEMNAFELEADFESLPNEFESQVPEDSTEQELAKLEFEVPPLEPNDLDIQEELSIVPQSLTAGSVSGEQDAKMPPIVVAGPPGGVVGRASMRDSALQLGATKESEQAVDRALRWFAAHQDEDGSWDFDLTVGACKGRCKHPGAGHAKFGATAIALLPFLGAGQTHEKGYHRAVVKKGLDYLIRNQPDNGTFQDLNGNMYSHGLATLALCEAVAMSSSTASSSEKGKFSIRLKHAAKRAIEFSVGAQHYAGGWRYSAGQPGDTSVLGWQAMAMRSAMMANIHVPKKSLSGISGFLDSVSADDYGATYGYTTAFPRPSMTAVGLLCRMYQGWGKQHAGIAQGVQELSSIGPSTNNVYYNYYATQVVHHYGGKPWKEWNALLRDHLVKTQEKEGHLSGSWYFDGDHGSGKGGRLYITSMATMTLEVYYRHMPMYQEKATKVKF